MGKGFEKGAKNAEKIFKKSAKPHGTSVAPCYVIDILLSKWCERDLGEIEPLTIQQIQDELHSRHKVFYSHNAIRTVINNLSQYTKTIVLNTRRVTCGNPRLKSYTQAFFIDFKNKAT